MNNLTKIIAIILTVVFVLQCTAFAEVGVPDGSMTGIALDSDAYTLTIGETHDTAVSASYSDNTTGVVTEGVTYQSSDTAVAEVDLTGRVTAVVPGEADITVTCQGFTAIAKVTIQTSVPVVSMTGITLDSNAYTLTIGEIHDTVVSAVYSDNTASIVTEGVTYQSSDNAVAEVDLAGKVTAVAPGEVDITVTYRDFTATAKVTVLAACVAGIILDSDVCTLAVGETHDTEVSAVYSDNTASTIAEGVTYQSSNTGVAAVSLTGRVTASAPGQTDITILYGGFTAVVKVTVLASLASPVLTITQQSGTVQLGWNAVEGALSYNVKRGKTPGTLGILASGITGTSFADTSADTGSMYIYAVAAVRDGIEGPASNIVVRPPVPKAPTLYGLRKPESVEINWTIEVDAVQYTLYRSTQSGGPYEVLADRTGMNSYDDTGAQSGTPYYYIVKAFDKQARESGCSNEVEVKPLEMGIQKFDPASDDDGDGITNEQELLQGTDMKVKDDPKVNSKKDKQKGKKRNVPKKISRQFKSKDNRTNVTVYGDDDLANTTLKAEDSEDKFLSRLKGIVGRPVELDAGGIDINSATITMKYDKNELNGASEDSLMIYWVDRENRKLVPLENVKVDKKSMTVSAVTTHFSTYLLGSSMEVDLRNVDIVFSIDQSDEMRTKDPNGYRLSLANRFFRDEYGQDNLAILAPANTSSTANDAVRIGLVEFSDFADVRQAPTNVVTDLDTAITGMNHTIGATNVADGLWVAKSQFIDNTRRRIMVLITDGKDTCGYTSAQIEDIVRGGGFKGIVVNTVAIGSDCDTTLLKDIAEITGGGFFQLDINASTTTDDIKEQVKRIYDTIIRQVTFEKASAPPAGYQAQLLKVETLDDYKGYDLEQARRLYSEAHTNLLTGNYIERATDIKTDNQGPDLSIERTYNSDDGGTKTIVGNGWRINYDTSVKAISQYGRVTASALNFRSQPVLDSNNIVTVLPYNKIITLIDSNPVSGQGNSYTWYHAKLADGKDGYVVSEYVQKAGEGAEVTYGSGTRIVFDKNTDGTYKVPFGVYDSLQKVTGGYTLTRKDQTKYNYNDAGKLTSIADRYGNALAISYNAQNNIDKVTDPVSRKLVFTYNSSNMLWKVADPLGRTAEYVYDTNGNLTEVIDLNGKKTTYNYYTGGKLRQTIDANGHQVIKNEYDPNGRLVRQYDGNNNIKYHIYKDIYKNEDGTYMPGYNKLQRFYIGENGYETMTEFSPVTMRPKSEMDAFGKSVQYRYSIDYSGNGTQWTDVTDLTGEVKNDPQYQAYINAVANGNKPTRETVTDKEGFTSTTEYDAMQNPVKITDPYLNYTSMQYDSKNNLIVKSDKKHNETRYTYDAQGVSLVSVTDPAGNTVKYDYYQPGPGVVINGLVHMVTEDRKDKDGNVLTGFKTTEYKYADGYNNRTETVGSLENHTCEVHDAAGRLKEVTDARGYKTKYTYDNMDRLMSEEDALGKKSAIQYDNVGNKRFATDKNGYTTEYVYDDENQLVKVTDPMGYSVQYKYDVMGNKCEETNQKGGVTKYDYDAVNRLVQVVDPLGNTTQYKYDVNGQDVQYTPGLNNVKVIDPKNNATITEYDKLYRKVKERRQYHDQGILKEKVMQYAYDANDNLEQVTDALGKITQYEYDALSRKAKVTDGLSLLDENGASMQMETSFSYNVYQNTSGEMLETVTQSDKLDDSTVRTAVKEYDTLGRLKKAIDAKQNATTYTYDAAGNMKTETDAKQHTTAYDYDQLNRVKKITDATAIYYTEFEYDANGNNTAKTDKRRNRTEYHYNGLNQVYEVVDPLGYITRYYYDEAGNRRAVIDPCGNTSEYVYDKTNRLVSETNGEGHTKYYEYDTVGNKTWESGRKDKYIGTWYDYDDLYRVVKVTSPELAEMGYTYDIMGNKLTERDWDQYTVTYEYDGLYRLKKAVYPAVAAMPSKTVNYHCDRLGNLISKDTSTGTADIYTYDELNRVLAHTQRDSSAADVITTSVTYDAAGNKETETDGNHVTKVNTYDELNRLKTSTITVSGTVQTTIYGYDPNGNMETVQDWRGNTTTSTYDALNRLTEKKDQNGITVQKLEYYDNSLQWKSYDALNNLTLFEYDRNGRLVRTTDPENHVISQIYDEDGNIKTKTDGRYNTTTFDYDGLGRLKTVTDAKNETTRYTYTNVGNILTQKDGKGNVTTFEYNAANKVTKRIDQGGRVGLSSNYTYDNTKVESYTYDADGNMQTKTDRNGNTTTYIYDVHGRLVTETVGGMSIIYTYDGNGNQLTMTDSTGTTTRTYDELNRVKTKTVPEIGTTVFQYDIISGVPDGCAGEISTDPKGNVATKVYDKAGRLTTVTSDGQTTIYSYYDNGNRKSVEYPGGAREEYTYYKDNLVWTLINKKADGTVLETYTYTYDAAHNQTSKVDGRGMATYTYDSLNRLETVTEPGGKATVYTFDAAGNRETETVTLGTNVAMATYSYNEQNRLTGIVTRTNGAINGTTAYTYDNNGNQLTVAQDGVTSVTNTYDVFNQLTVTVTGGTAVTNTYNGEGLRVAKSVNGTLTRYLCDYDKVVLELDGSGNLLAKNVYGTNLLTRTAGSDTYYYMYNGHADVTALLRPDGTIAATYYYDAFGVPDPTGTTGSANNNVTYAGYQYDKEAGVYYLNARMYDPKIARFLQEDTYTGDSNDPLSLNLYTYCHNEPIMYTDPTGHYSERDMVPDEALPYYDMLKAKEQAKWERIQRDLWEIVNPASKPQGFEGFDSMYKYLNDKDWARQINEEFTTDWQTEGLLYGVKQHAADVTVNLLYTTITQQAENSIPEYAKHQGKKFNFDIPGITKPAITFSHKEPLFKENKMSFKGGEFSGVVLVEGAMAYGGALTAEINLAGKVRGVISGLRQSAQGLKVLPEIGVSMTDGELLAMRGGGSGVEITQAIERLALPAVGESSFNIGERLVSRNVYENYIKGQESFRLGAPNVNSFFFNKAGANPATRSFEAAVNAGFTRQNIADTIRWGDNELVRIRFKLDKIDNITVPGVSKIPDGIGDGIIPGTNELFTGKGWTQNYLGQRRFDEFIGSNVRLAPEDIVEVKYLGRIKK